MTLFIFQDLDVSDISNDVDFNTKGPFDVYIGNRELMLKHNVDVSVDAEKVLQEHEEKGRTGVYVSVNGEICT